MKLRFGCFEKAIMNGNAMAQHLGNAMAEEEAVFDVQSHPLGDSSSNS